MAVSVSCPECAASYPVSEELLGKKMRCKGCQAVFVASAAKVKVGATVGAGRSGSTEPASNGVHKPTPRSKEASQQSGSGGFMLAGIAGAGLFAIMAAVTVWAVFLKNPSTDDSTTSTSSVNPAPKININETPAAETKTSEKAKVEEKAQPKLETKPEKRTGPAWFVEAPANLPFALRPEINERIKASGAYIKCDGGSGSGWFAEPGIVITNSHVIGMKEPVSPPPKNMKVIIHSGLPTERTFVPELLGIDRENDLAILKIEGDNLPEPMPIARSSVLREGHKMFAVGFPHGSRNEKQFAGEKEKLETRIKVRETSVAGRLPTIFNSIRLLQIEGGVDPGNSGGMLTDGLGNVRGVVVMQYPGTNMRFCIPSEYVIYLLQGRILDLTTGQAYMAGEQIKMPVTINVADPMKRIKSVAVEFWAGEPGRRVRPSATKQPTPVSGDTPRQTIAFKYDPNQTVRLGEAHVLTSEVDLTPLSAGQVYWVQPHYVGIDGADRWGEAVAIGTAGIPVERKPATLALRHQKDAKYLIDMETHFALGVFPEHGEQNLRDSGLKLKLTETTQSVQPDGTAKILLRYDDVKLADEDEQTYMKTSARGLLEAARGMMAELQITKAGVVQKPVLKADKVPVVIRRLLNVYNTQTIQSLETLSLGLPDKEIRPGDTWDRSLNYTVSAYGLTENALFNLKYKYVGSRVRDGREEAVIEYAGDIVRGDPPPIDPTLEKGKKGEKSAQPRARGFFGKMRGSALVDMSTGLVTIARSDANLQFEVDFPLDGFLTFGGEYRVEFNRHLPGTTAVAEYKRLLPNQTLPLYPFVGAPDLTIGE